MKKNRPNKQKVLMVIYRNFHGKPKLYMNALHASPKGGGALKHDWESEKHKTTMRREPMLGVEHQMVSLWLLGSWQSSVKQEWQNFEK